MNKYPVIPLNEICRPKQWPTIGKSEMSDDAEYPVYGANGIIGRYDRFNHEKPTILIGCRGSCGVLHVTESFAYVTGNAMALDDLDEKRITNGFTPVEAMASVFSGSVSPL